MRPLIDANNLSHSKEKLIYYSQTTVFTWFLAAFGLLIFAIYSLTNKNGFIAFFLLLPVILFLTYHASKLLKRIDEVQFRINSKGIQYRNEELVSWCNIENERVDTKISGRSSTDFFIYYIIDQNKIIKYNISNLNIDREELQLTLKINRNRYPRENIL
ncbi:hypothetical protein [Flavobacterium hydrophilum]|uniref:Uncharacterized protein n=1 Tax=Flavobacterium hydrophilum TaxID=2211445 RepID=A0A2V4CDX3_9FLAO|nr:hypothetical protein [Flavobacterium hydrophilum]PXY44254.1 hypothetical protein DMB68_17685 [Flavobacterium hydrophilum]